MGRTRRTAWVLAVVVIAASLPASTNAQEQADAGPPRDDGGARDGGATRADAPEAEPPQAEPADSDDEAPQARESEDEPNAIPPASRTHEGVVALHIRMAKGFYESGRFEQAAREYERAYDRSGDPRLLYQAFVAWREAGAIGEAVGALERYLDAQGAVSNRGELERQLGELRRRAAQERATAGASESQSDAEPEPGAEAGAELESGVVLEPESDAAAAEADPGSGTVTGPQFDPESDAESGSGEVLRKRERDGASVAAWVVVGAGAGLLAGAIATGVLALQAEKDLEDLCTRVEAGAYRCPPDSSFESTKDRGQVMATASDVLLLSGLLAVTAGFGLRYLLGDGGVLQSASATMGCAPGGCGGSLRVRF